MGVDRRTTMSESSFQVLSFERDDQNGTSRLQARRYQKRKAHSKSKGGCTGCKIQRVKCDETRPACKRCQRSGAPCTYLSDDGSRSSLARSIKDECPSSGSSSISSGDSSLSVFDASLGLDQRTSRFGTPRIVLLRHFSEIFKHLASFGAAEPSSFISLGLSRPHLLDAMLAVAASHLRHHTSSAASHRVAEHFQQSLAVRRFQSALSEPLVDQAGADSLLLTAMLLNLLAFSLVEDGDDESVARSWVFSDAPGRLDWFSLQLGYKPLLMATKAWHGGDTIMRWMFEASDDDQRTYNGGPRALCSVPPHWLRLCDLGPDDDSGESIFHEPLRILAEIKDLEPVAANYFLYLAVVGRFDFEFRDLVQANDERAMWVFGYWLGLCSRFGSEYWWLRSRAVRDHRAIVIWLGGRGVEARDGAEGQMWRDLMEDLETAQRWKGMAHVDRDISEVFD